MRVNGRGDKLLTPFNLQVQENIYGGNDSLRHCHPNSESPRNSFQLDTAAPGEVIDRYRTGAYQTLGYPVGSMTDLLRASELLENAGYRAYGYRGIHRQSLQLALDYYAYYFTKYMDIKRRSFRTRPTGIQAIASTSESTAVRPGPRNVVRAQARSRSFHRTDKHRILSPRGQAGRHGLRRWPVRVGHLWGFDSLTLD